MLKYSLKSGWKQSVELKTASLLHFHAIFSTMALMRAQKEQGCWVRECVWCCSLIDVTVRVSLLEETRPYCSSLTHCPPRTHNILCLSLSHTHFVQWLQFPAFLLLLSSSSPHRPFISCSLHHSFFIPSPLLLSAFQPRLHPGGQPTVMIALSSLHLLSWPNTDGYWPTSIVLENILNSRLT